MCLFDIDTLKKEDIDLKEKINKSNFWDDQEQAQRILKISKKVELKIQEYDEIVKDYEDLSVLFELSMEDESLED